MCVCVQFVGKNFRRETIFHEAASEKQTQLSFEIIFKLKLNV